MNVTTFESLPADVVFYVFKYLSPIDIVQSFLSINERLSRMIMYEYLWHIHIDDSTKSLLVFNDYCQNILKVIGRRLVSLRVTLTNVIGGWSLISSSLRYHYGSLSLQRLHLIDIKPHEFDRLLRSHLVKQLHTLLVDITNYSLFKEQTIEGLYLTKVCSQLPCLTVCQLPFDIRDETRNESDKRSLMPQIFLPSILNTRHLRQLTIGMNSSYFLERLLTCIPFIENLSIGVKDPRIKDKDHLKRRPLPVDAHLLSHLSHLSINCSDNHTFYRSMALLSTVLNQLTHFSLKLEEYGNIYDPLIISNEIIQQLCINRLNASATYDLNLLFCIECDTEEKRIFNSFINHPFVYQQQSKIFIQETNHCDPGDNCHSFIVYTAPFTDKKFSSHLLCRNSQIFSRTAMNPLNLFQHAREFYLDGCLYNNCFSDLHNCGSLAFSMVPWSLLTKISICGTDFITSSVLELILKMTPNVHILEIIDDTGRLPRKILRNKNNLGHRINKQIHSLSILDYTTILLNAEQFCVQLYNQLPKLKNLSFHISDSYGFQKWKPLSIVDGKNKSTIFIVKLLRFVVDHFQELVSFHIHFFRRTLESDSPCFPHLIRKQLHEQPLSRSYRLRCSDEVIQIWL